MKVISIHLNSAVATQPEVLNLAISIDLPKQKNVCKMFWIHNFLTKQIINMKQEQRAFTN